MLHFVVVSVFLFPLKNAFLPDWNRCCIWYSNNKPVKVQTCWLFFVITGLYADIQIPLHNCLKTCKQADKKTSRQDDMSTGLYIYVQTWWIVYMKICLHEKVQACRLFFITAGLYADKQILLHNYLLVCKQADMFAGNKEDFQTGWHVCMVICLCTNMMNGI